MATTPNSPVTPESSAPPAATTPSATAPVVNKTDTSAPVTTPVQTPTDKPAIAPEAIVAPGDGILDALKGDLTPVVDDVPASQPVDLATKYKDDPAVQALLAEQKQYAPIVDVLKGNKYAIASPQELTEQLADSNALYDIMNGRASSAQLLDVMLKNPAWSNESKQKAISDIVQYIGQLTGQPIAAAAAGQPIKDPAMERVEKLEAAIKADRDAKDLAAFTARVGTAKTTIQGKIGELLKGTFLDGDAEYVMSQLGSQFTQDKVMGIVEAAERGDFTQVQKAIQKVKNAEATRFKNYYDRIIAMKTKKADTIPQQVAGGSAPAPAVEPGNVVSLNTDERRAKMLQEFRSGQ